MRRVLNKRNRGFLMMLLVLIVLMVSIGGEALKAGVYPIARGLQHKFVLYKIKEYKTLETKHFVIRYQSEDEEIISLVAKAAEKDYLSVSDMFNYYPKDKTTVVVYDDSVELMKNANLGQGKPPMGVYYASTIQILSPKLWIGENENMEEMFFNEGPMVHEFSHLLIDDLTNGNYPLWFTEGMALYQEYVQTGYEWGKGLDYDGEPYTLEQLTNEFHELDEMLAYKRSFEIVKDMVEDHGFDNVNQVLRMLGQGKSFEDAKEEVFKKE